jgi:hypothetical protein
VAISVAHERLTAEDAEHAHKLRAQAALTTFMNALSISLFSLIPGVALGWTALVVSVIGLFFVLASSLSIRRVLETQPGTARDALFLVGIAVAFAFELYYALRLIVHPGHTDAAHAIAVLVVVCFIIGIARSWELIGGPEIGLARELGELVRERKRTRD